MPKEYVYGDPLAFEPAGDSPDAQSETPVVDIGWSREAGDVQLATRLRECEIFWDEDNPDAPIPAKYGYYVTLNRSGINDLIRYLRKARDQAFGRDE